MKHPKKRIGRGQGSGNGKTAGRGHKGAKSRSGFHYKRGFEGGQMPLHRRVPKRGFHNPFRVEYEVVNLDTIEARFDAGTVVTPELLREHRLVQSADKPVKVLGRGEIAKKLTITLRKSPIGFNRNQAAVVQSMGLRRINHSVQLLDTPATRGMILKVRHLVEVG